MSHSMVEPIVRSRLLDGDMVLVNGCFVCGFARDVLCIHQSGIHWITRDAYHSI